MKGYANGVLKMKTNKLFSVVGMLAIGLMLSFAFVSCSGKKKASSNVSSQNIGTQADPGTETTEPVSQNNDRKEINDFLKSYEAVVVAAEKAAKSNKITDLMNVQQKAIEMSEQADEIQGYEEWTAQDSQKYLDLTNRYTTAMSSLSNSANTGSLSF
jgi:hypothetical protein